MGLNIKHRPKTFDDLHGNDVLKETVKSKLDNLSQQCFFFIGKPGTGKTTLSRIIKEYLNISDMDYYEYNAADTRGIGTIRAVEKSLPLAPLDGDKKLYLLDEFHQMTIQAIEDLLKVIEEPPSHVFFVLCTYEPEKIKPLPKAAIKRRCFSGELQLLKRKEMSIFIKSICKKEKKAIEVPVLRNIIKHAEGSAGVAISLLDIVIDLDDKEKALEAIRNASAGEAKIKEICKILLDVKNSEVVKWKNLRAKLNTLAGDSEKNRYAMLGYLNAVLLSSDGMPDSTVEMIMLLSESVMYSGAAGLNSACFLCCKVNMDDIPF